MDAVKRGDITVKKTRVLTQLLCFLSNIKREEQSMTIQQIELKKNCIFKLKQTNQTLREKCPNTEFFLVRIFPYSVQMRENTDQKKLRIWTPFAQWILFIFKN